MRICIILLSLAAPALAHAGTCRVFADGENTVEACQNGTFTVTDRHGHTRVFGELNAGFPRYPGQPEMPLYQQKENGK